jgi:hypothetical protein
MKRISFLAAVLVLSLAGLGVSRYTACAEQPPQGKTDDKPQPTREEVELRKQLDQLKQKLGATEEELAAERDKRQKIEATLQKELAAERDRGAVALRRTQELLEQLNKTQKETQEALARLRDEAARAQKVQEVLADLARARDQEVKALRDKLEAENAKLAQRLKELELLKVQAINAQVEANLLKERNQRLEERIRELEKERVREPIKPMPMKNPPAENVEGLIKKVDATANLVTISIGSDAGLAKGHTLEVYRLKPSPKYLGTIRVVEVSPTEAVAQFVGKTAAPPEPGDHVASKIMGN